MSANSNHGNPESTEAPRAHQARGVWALVVLPALATAALLTASAPGRAHGRAEAGLAWVAFLPFFWALRKMSSRRAALAGLVAGSATWLGWAAWMPGLIARFSGWSPRLAIFAAMAFALWHGAGFSLWSHIVHRMSGRVPQALVAPSAFVLLEQWFPSAFPWSLGLSQYRCLDLAQIAELGGPSALSFLEVFAAAMLARAWLSLREGRQIAWRTLLLLSLALMATLGFGCVRRRQIESLRARAPTLRVAGIQAGNALVGWSRQTVPDLLDRYRKATKDLERTSGRFDLVLWPEKASPVLRKDAAHDYPSGHARRIGDGFDSPLLFGAEALDVRSDEQWNAAALLSPDNRLRVVYSKVQLILWSEWLPSWAERWWGRRYRAGVDAEPFLVDPPPPEREPLSIGAFICFEAGFPAHVRRLVAHGAELLVNLSDDSWFGPGAEPDQHLAHAVFRAIETRRDLVRIAGSGVSAFITATGQVERSLPISQAGDPPAALIAEPRRLRIGSLAILLGNAFCLACAGIVLSCGILAWRRGATPEIRTW